MSRVLKPFEMFTDTSDAVCIWLNGEPKAVTKRAEGVWNGAKYLVATDGAVNEIQKRAGDVLWPHVICGDFDSLDPKIDIRDAQKVSLPDQDRTDLTKAVMLCLERKRTSEWTFEKIVVLGGLNGRLDHTMATLSTLVTFKNDVPIYVLDARNLVMGVREGSSEIHVDLEKTTRMCGVIPLAPKQTEVTSNGLKYEMDCLPLSFGSLISTSNEVTQNRISISTTSLVIFTIEVII